MGEPFLSRHYISERGTALASVPFAPPASNTINGGVPSFLAHTILALGSWNEDAQEHRLSVFDAAIRYTGSDASTPSVNRLASFQHPGAVTAVSSVDLGDGSVMIVAASSEGSLSRLRMTVPTAPGSFPTEIQLKGEDLDDAMVLPCVQDVHGGGAAISGLDVHPDTRTVLSTSVKGSISLSSLDGATCSNSMMYNSNGAAAFTDAKWASSHAFFTSSLQGMVNTWDTRQGDKPTLKLLQNNTINSPALTLAVNPAQPFLCATSYNNGEICLWDTRTAATALSTSIPGYATSLSFVSGDMNQGQGQGQLAFCSSKGLLGAVDTTTGGVKEIYQEPSAGIRGMVVSSFGAVKQVFAITEQEGVVFIANAL